jgi:hypothetical protein
MMSGPLAKKGYYGFTNMTGDLVLALPKDASFQLNAKVSEKHDIVSDFPLKYTNETPPPPPAPKPSPQGKVQPVPKTGPVVAPIIVERATVVTPTPYLLRRITAICGSGDATIAIASFGGTVRLKKI